MFSAMRGMEKFAAFLAARGVPFPLFSAFFFISERTDLPGSCERFRADATGLSDYKFLEINTGQSHGFLFRPLEDWVVTTIDWAQRNRSPKSKGSFFVTLSDAFLELSSQQRRFTIH